MNIDHLTTAPEMPSGLNMLQRIGRGGSGNIFMVQDITGKLLALKSIDSRWQQKELDSITFLRNLPAHPAITQIYQTGQLSDGSFFYTMELADNAGNEQHYLPDTLAHRISCGKLAAVDAMDVIRSITDGVIHLHEYRMFHGDIKPENIIFINGQAKISDFGTLSGSGDAGTAGFIPDEPAGGVDRDCYALAKTLYCAYSGYDAADFPSPPENFNADEFKIIRRIYMQGCAGQPGKRFTSATDFRYALEQAISRINQPHETEKKRFKTAVFIGALLLLSGIALTFLPVSKKEEVKPDEPLPPAAAETQTENLPPADDKPTVAPDRIEKQAPAPQTDNKPDESNKPQESSRPNYPRYGMEESVIRLSRRFRGDFIIFPDFREKFDTVYREMPDRLDAEFCQLIIQYYTDLDRFLQLRRELSSSDITPEERSRLFRQNDYRAFYNSLEDRNRIFMSVHKWGKQFRLVCQLYDTIIQQKQK